MNSLTSVAITGVGESEYGRVLEPPLFDLIANAARKAIEDAGLSPADIDGFASTPGVPPADELAAAIGVKERRFTAQASVAGAGTVGAAQLAQLAISAGLSKHVLVYYGIKTSRPGGAYAFHAADPHKADLEMPLGFYGQPLYFAALAQRYRHEYGLTDEQLGEVPVAARAWARMTPGSQKQDPLTLDDYLENPVIATPFRKLDCCLNSDGAAAYVVSSLEAARDLPNPPAVVAGVGFGALPVTLSEMFTQNPDLIQFAGHISSKRAYEQAGLGPEDVDFAEIYDCFTISVLLQMEELGLCGRGEAASFVEGGRIGPGGDMPVNTHGGHMSNAYIPGTNHVVEAVRQIRGVRGEAQVKDAEVGVIAGLGGNEHATMVLTVDG